MADEATYTQEEHAHHMAERKELTDAAREGSRTFDQAVLAFGAAVFGASVAFLKDVAPKPQLYSIKWLAMSWVSFTAGLLAVILSFLCSHRACLFRIEESERVLLKAEPIKNPWPTRTDLCNLFCVLFLFIGVALWIVFATENLANPGGVKNEQPSSATTGPSQEGLRPAENSANPVHSTAATAASK